MNRRKLNAGEAFFSDIAHLVTADVLQEVAVCIHDQKLRCGAMAVCRGADTERLLTDLLRQFKTHGSQRSDLVVKIAGGAISSIPPPDGKPEHQTNLLCKKFGIPVSSRSTGGPFSRSLRFDTASGELLVKRTEPQKTDAVSFATVPGPAPATPIRKIRVLIVDDSSVIRNLFQKALGSQPDIDIFGLAEDPMAAERLMSEDTPDVITLDMQMPQMDGLTYIQKHLADRKIPTIVVTGAGSADGDLAFRALEAGAIDFVEKPAAENMAEFCRDLADKVRAVSQVTKTKLVTAPSCIVKTRSSGPIDKDRVIVIGSSTGGTSALTNILTSLQSDIPPILIVQHIPPVFSRLFAERLNSLVTFEVKEAANNDLITPGRVLIAPGGRQMKIRLVDRKLVVVVTDDPPVNKHAPSVDYLFDSVAEVIGPKAVGVILTGMGKDGARGLLKLRQSGSPTIGQDEHTSVVYGMPREAAMIGAVEHVLPLHEIPGRMISMCSGKIRKIPA